jgi:hypothetical protein
LVPAQPDAQSKFDIDCVRCFAHKTPSEEKLPSCSQVSLEFTIFQQGIQDQFTQRELLPSRYVMQQIRTPPWHRGAGRPGCDISQGMPVPGFPNGLIFKHSREWTSAPASKSGAGSRAAT